MDDQNRRYTRLRHVATGALAALAVVGAVAGTAALAANPHAEAGQPAGTSGGATKTPAPGASGPAQPDPSQQFMATVRRLVSAGTIDAAQGRILDRQILAGRLDQQALASSGFTQSQLQAVQQALANTKRALASSAHRPSPGSTSPAAAPGLKPPPPGAGSAPTGPGKNPKAPARAASVKARAAQTSSGQPFLAAVQRLVRAGTINAAEGRILDRQILAGRIDTQTLASSGFTRSQLQAVGQTLATTKRSL